MGCCSSDSYEKSREAKAVMIPDESAQGLVDQEVVNVKEEEKQNRVIFLLMNLKCLKNI